MFVHSFIHLGQRFCWVYAIISGIISYFKKMISKDLRIRSAETSPITRLGGDTKKTSTCCRKRAVISRLSRSQKPEVAASNCTPWQCVLSTLFLPLNGKCLSIVEGPCPHFSYSFPTQGSVCIHNHQRCREKNVEQQSCFEMSTCSKFLGLKTLLWNLNWQTLEIDVIYR